MIATRPLFFSSSSRNGTSRAQVSLMTTYPKMKAIAILMAGAFIGLPAFAHQHTALNGTWTLIPDKCDFAGQRAIQSGSVTIDERQGNITVSRNFAYREGTGTQFYSDMTDGENGATIRTGADMKSKTRWDHDVLKVTTTQSGTTTVESYSLAPDGGMAVSVVRPGQKPATLYFRRQ